VPGNLPCSYRPIACSRHLRDIDTSGIRVTTGQEACHRPILRRRRHRVVYGLVMGGVVGLIVIAAARSAPGTVDDLASAGNGTPAVHSARATSSQDLLDRAEQVLTQRCMQERGFRYWLTAANPLPQDRDFPYVIDDPKWAAQYGYGTDLQREAEFLRRTDPNLRYLQGLAPQRQVDAGNALNGAGPAYVEAALPTGGMVRHYSDGCAAQADRSLYGDLDSWYRAKKVTENLAGVRRAKVTSDAAFSAAMSLAGCRCFRSARCACSSAASAATTHPSRSGPWCGPINRNTRATAAGSLR
jgi:hypothetical protein